MLQLHNKTPYEAKHAIQLDVDGSEILVIAVKATFNLKQKRCVLADEPAPVCLVDEFYGKPGSSSLRYENELVFKKPRTDLIINGHAYAPQSNPIKTIDVSVRIHRYQKSIRIYGERFFYQSFLKLAISEPQPFIKMPLIYEKAFGGVDSNHDDPKQHGEEARNLIGAGFGMIASHLKDKPLPNLEDPQEPIRSWKDRPKPAGFGLICKHWMPRRQYLGTCDQKWLKERMPLYPLDFNYRFFQGAHPDLRADSHLLGGELVELTHLTPEGHLSFELPHIKLGLKTRLSGQWIEHSAQLGSVIIEPDIPRLMLVWQSWLPCHRKKFELDKTVIVEK